MAKAYRTTVNMLTAELGGSPSGQELLLIQRVSFKVLKIHLAELEMLAEKNETLEGRYLAWANSLRLDLQALGLQRRAKNIMNLKAYIEEKSE